MSTIDQTLGSLARTIPGATALFREYQLDYGWRGDLSLRAAVRERGLENAEELVTRLEALRETGSGDDDWTRQTSAELIDHILARYHHRHREHLPEIIGMARKVERVHAGHAECPEGLADHLSAMQQELESHMLKEEQILFPLLAEEQHERAQAPLSVMRQEHVQHGSALEQLYRLTGGLNPPAGACGTWRTLYQEIDTLCAELTEHIHLENNILFEGLNRPAAEMLHE